jgi:Membrane domain of glycerophosphoryl diester phosphodiesterase
LSAPSYTPQLRPLSVGEMLDAGFRLFRHRFGTLVACVVVPVVPLTILGTIVTASTDPNAYDVNAPATETGTALAGFLISLFLQSAGAALAVAACFKAISAAYLGERTSFGDSLGYAFRRFIPLMIAYVVVVLITIPGFILLIIPGIWLSVKLCMAFPAVVFERAGPFRAVGRSWKLMRDNWWRVFGTLLVIFLIAFVVNFALTAVLGVVAAGSDTISELAFALLATIITLLTYMLTYPLWAAVMTVIYYDLRVRNEGFDLQLLARGVGSDTSRFESSPERPLSPPPPGQGGGGGFRPPEEPATSS